MRIETERRGRERGPRGVEKRGKRRGDSVRGNERSVERVSVKEGREREKRRGDVRKRR